MSISSVSVRTPSLCSFVVTFPRFSLASLSVVDFTTFDCEGFGDRIRDTRETFNVQNSFENGRSKVKHRVKVDD